MNQQTTTNPSFTSNSSASSLSLVTSDVQTVATGSNSPAQSPAQSLAKTSSARLTSSAAKCGSAAAKTGARCRHFTATGRRCRLSVLDSATGLCFRHVGLQFQPSDEDLSPAFGGLVTGLQSACGIHDFLSQLTVLLVQNRISTRRAAILAYLGQTLLRTLPAVQDELEPEPQITFDLPRSKRDDVVDPERATYARLAKTCAPVTTPVEPDGYDGYTSDLDKSK